MKKIGFTLSEVLIALGVLGVIAALSLPTLISGHQKRVAAASLKVAVSNFETGLKSMIVKENSPSLFASQAVTSLPANGLNDKTADANVKAFMGNLGEYFQFINYAKGVPSGYKKNNLGANTELPASVSFSSKNGVIYFLNLTKSDAKAKNERAVRKAGYSLASKAGYVYIDANGIKPPNKLGVDVFAYVVGADGTLYPYDSEDVTNYKK